MTKTQKAINMARKLQRKRPEKTTDNAGLAARMFDVQASAVLKSLRNVKN